MRERGAHIARCCRPGDLVILSGDLGAGKTTFVQGMGSGLGVVEQITSPTFVIARVYPTPTGSDLVHVDAYRLGSSLELDDLDLDSDLDSAITVVEWGEGKVEQLSEDRVVITITRSDSDDDETRVMSVAGFGARWDDTSLQELLA
jgi:tRNA threonylcarbamoyladenosine biosynthesis protein TsaE